MTIHLTCPDCSSITETITDLRTRSSQICKSLVDQPKSVKTPLKYKKKFRNSLELMFVAGQFYLLKSLENNNRIFIILQKNSKVMIYTKTLTVQY